MSENSAHVHKWLTCSLGTRHFTCVLSSRPPSVVANIHSHFASEETEVVGDEVPSSGLTGSRACPSTFFSPAHGLDDLLTFSVLALCRRT